MGESPTLDARTDRPIVAVSGRWSWGAPCLLALVLAVGYVVLSVNRHVMLQTTGYDLGIFEQAVRAYAEGRAPVSPLRGEGFNLLGDHFHPVLAVLAPFYALFPSPITLLVAQAVLIAVSAIPVTRLAVRRLGTGIGITVGIGYGLSWGLLSALDFDFHEICFAVPLLAFASTALAERRWRAAAAWAIPLVLVKEGLCLTVAAVGAYLFLHGARRLGIALVLFGLASFAVIVGLVIPAFAPDGSYGQGHNLGLSGGVPEMAVTLGERLASPAKLLTLVILLAPTAFLAVFSPMALLALPTLLWRFLSANPFHASTGFHYDAVLMPILFVALVQVLTTRPKVRRLAAAAAVVAAAVSVGTVLDDRQWSADDRVTAARTLMAMIPDGATVAASNHLVPHLTSTHTVQLFPSHQGNAVTARWVVVDTDFGHWPSSPDTQEEELWRLQNGRYSLVRELNGYVLLVRPQP